MAASCNQKVNKQEYYQLDTCDDVPIQVEKTGDLRIESFEYIQCNIPGPGANRTDFMIKFRGCNCYSSCESALCSCLQNYGTNYEANGRLLPHETDGFSIPIIECNSSCTCSMVCRNRLVQHGIQISLCVYCTKLKGWGLKTLEFIPSRKFVCEYAGEIVNENEAKKRCKELKLSDDNYLLTVLEHLSDGTIMKTYVDPCLKGNVGRFINHSCEPNLMMIPIRVENAIPKFCLFAKRDILADEELTFNYSGDDVNDVNESNDAEINNRKKCFCESKKCVGFLPYCHSLFN